MLNGYDNPNPTPRAPGGFVHPEWHPPNTRVVNPLSDRVYKHILNLEEKGETARKHSFMIIPQIDWKKQKAPYRCISIQPPIIRRDDNFWQKMGNRTLYHLYGLNYFSGLKGDPETCGIQTAINHAKSRIFIADFAYPMLSGLTLLPGISIEGESMPQIANQDPSAPEQITFTTNANGDAGTLLNGGTGLTAFSGNSLLTNSIVNLGLNAWGNGFSHGALNTLGMAKAYLARILFATTATSPTVLGLTNIQNVRMDQIYAWCPAATSGNFIFANNNHSWFGGNSYWTDLFCHGYKNINGAIFLKATTGGQNLIEAHRLQVNMQDAAFVNGTSGYGLYLQGLVNATGMCSNNTFHGLNIEGTPLKAVRLEDYSFYNYVHIALDNLAAGGFDFSLKKNATAQAPLNNMLVYSNTQTVAVECDNLQNFLITAGNLTPITGAYPAGINGVGAVNFAGAQFTSFFGGGSGQAFVGMATKGTQVAQTGNANLVTALTPASNQEYEVGAELIVTAISAGTLAIQVTFTDQFNLSSRTVTIPINNAGAYVASVNATGYYDTPTHTVSSVSAGTITVKVVATGFTGTWTGSGFVRATG